MRLSIGMRYRNSFSLYAFVVTTSVFPRTFASESIHDHSWKKVTTIYGENRGDYSGAAVRLNAKGDGIAINSYNQGSIIHGKTILFIEGQTDGLDEIDLTPCEWPETDKIEYTLRSLGARLRLAIAGHGKRLAIGSHFNLAVYDFNATDGSWTSISAPSGFDNLSKTVMDVDLSYKGDVLAISSYSFGIGQTEMFKRNNDSEWMSVGSPIVAESENEAVSLAGDGHRVAISEKLNGSGRNNAGMSRVYEFNTTTLDWQVMGSVIIGMPGDFAGKSLALSRDGSTLAFGAPYSDVVLANETKASVGTVHVYRFDDLSKEWRLFGDLLMGDRPYMAFGNAIDLSSDGTIIAVGNAHTLKRDQTVRIFRYLEENSEWIQLGKDIESDRALKTYFGISLSLSDNGKTLAIGSPGASRKGDANSTFNVRNAGMTAIYKYADEETDVLILVNSRETSWANDKTGSKIEIILLISFVSMFFWCDF